MFVSSVCFGVLGGTPLEHTDTPWRVGPTPQALVPGRRTKIEPKVNASIDGVILVR